MHCIGAALLVTVAWSMAAATVVQQPLLMVAPSRSNGAGCKTNTDCTLSGVCSPSGVCKCNAGWTGTDCHSLDTLPAPGPWPGGGAYGVTPNVTSWGGSIVTLPGTSARAGGPSASASASSSSSSTHHLFVTEEAGGCGMTSWKSNSQIVHAVSTTGPTGPFVRQAVAIPYATNPAVIYDDAAAR